MEKSGGSKLLQMKRTSMPPSMKARGVSKSLDHGHWWEPQHWQGRGLHSLSSQSLEADPENIRNGWLTFEPKAQYQQKQLAEREQKIASLYEAQQARALDRVRHSPSSTGTSGTTSPPPAHVPHGKVRQMFEERRTKGIDKSYPLQPIHNTRPQPPPGVTGHSKSTTSTAARQEKKRQGVTARKPVVNHKSENRLVNGSGDVNHNHEADLHTHKYNNNNNNNHVKQKPLSNRSLAQTELRNLQQLESLDALDALAERGLIADETFPDALEPASPRDEPTRPPRRSPSMKSSTARAPPAHPAPVAPPRRSNTNVTNNTRPQRTMQQPAKTVTVARKQKMSQQSPSAAAVGAGDACAVCGRRFAPDRLAKHEAICKKTSTKKRKPFDALKHRLAGTEAEPFIGKVRKQSVRPSASKPLNSTWRQKHEEFINAIRSAKLAQAHVAAGGKLTDLPPPPPSENPDYVKCPHCDRRFNQSAAERHIPKCATYQFNKTKPAAKRR